MIPVVISVVPLNNHELEVQFASGEEGVLDMKPYLDVGRFSQLKDAEAFRRVRVSFKTIEWECGLDLDPVFVHKHTQFTVQSHV